MTDAKLAEIRARAEALRKQMDRVCQKYSRTPSIPASEFAPLVVMLTEAENDVPTLLSHLAAAQERITRLERACAIFEKNSADATAMWEALQALYQPGMDRNYLKSRGWVLTSLQLWQNDKAEKRGYTAVEAVGFEIRHVFENGKPEDPRDAKIKETQAQQAAQAAELERVKGERDEARETNRRLNRRCQFLESAESEYRHAANALRSSAQYARETLRFSKNWRKRAMETTALLADTKQELAASQSRAEKAEQERDAALRQCSELAKQAGLAQGELAASEMAGMVRDWKERAERAEGELAKMREESDWLTLLRMFVDSEHTKGPWEVGQHDRNGQRVVRGEHIEICTCWHHCVGELEREMEANAKLIAAAPRLLEACKVLAVQRDKAVRGREHTQQWYGVRLKRIGQLIREETSLDVQQKFFSIVANATAECIEPPTYDRQLEIAKHKAERLEQDNATLLEFVRGLWNLINQRRCELIQRQANCDNFSPTEAEELEQLQALSSQVQSTLAAESPR